jgi:hypothetical protein
VFDLKALCSYEEVFTHSNGQFVEVLDKQYGQVNSSNLVVVQRLDRTLSKKPQG